MFIRITPKRLFIAPIYHTRWEHRALNNNTNSSLSLSGTGKQVRLEGGLERGGRIRVAECLGQIVPDRWASVRKLPAIEFVLLTPISFTICSQDS